MTNSELIYDVYCVNKQAVNHANLSILSPKLESEPTPIQYTISDTDCVIPESKDPPSNQLQIHLTPGL